jgi:hypothetical protein
MSAQALQVSTTGTELSIHRVVARFPRPRVPGRVVLGRAAHVIAVPASLWDGSETRPELARVVQRLRAQSEARDRLADAILAEVDEAWRPEVSPSELTAALHRHVRRHSEHLSERELPSYRRDIAELLRRLHAAAYGEGPRPHLSSEARARVVHALVGALGMPQRLVALYDDGLGARRADPRSGAGRRISPLGGTSSGDPSVCFVDRETGAPVPGTSQVWQSLRRIQVTSAGAPVPSIAHYFEASVFLAPGGLVRAGLLDPSAPRFVPSPSGDPAPWRAVA